jgi:hypothetical protein
LNRIGQKKSTAVVGFERQAAGQPVAEYLTAKPF